MIESVLSETNNRMMKSISILENELKRVRTGRASLSLLDGIRVEYYGALTELSQMATLSSPDSRMITVQPWDTSLLKHIEKAILKSDLGLTPSNDGKIVRIPIPPLTEDRRKELIKVVHKICEEYKVAIRNIRRDSNVNLKDAKIDKIISEDIFFKTQGKVQKITNDYTANIDEIEKDKVKEILEF